MVEYVEQKTGKPVSTAISTAGTTGSVLWLSAAFLFTAFALPENIQMNPNVSANVSAKQNRHPEDACKSLKKMVGTAGFEPTASCPSNKLYGLLSACPDRFWFALTNSNKHLVVLSKNTVTYF